MTNLEIADALDARAAKAQRDFDHSFAAFGDDPPKQEPAEATLYRAAAQKLRQMDEALKPFAECADDMLIDRFGVVDPVAYETVSGKASVRYSHFAAARSARTET